MKTIRHLGIGADLYATYSNDATAYCLFLSAPKLNLIAYACYAMAFPSSVMRLHSAIRRLPLNKQVHVANENEQLFGFSLLSFYLFTDCNYNKHVFFVICFEYADEI